MTAAASPPAATAATATSGAATFDSLDPATGAVVATLPVDGEEQVRAAVARAREAARWWGALSFAERRHHLLAVAAEIIAGADDLADLIRRENGKPLDDALLEVVLAVDHLRWAAANAERVLRRRRVRSTLLMVNQAACVEHVPFGVIGVIGPWNYPVHTPMGSISYALAAGNAVVFKPSEHTPAIGHWLGEACSRSVPERRLVEVVTGFGETGAHLCRAGVDKLAFTGSPATGRTVMAACAASLTPVLLELGGKDPLIVDEDADLDRAASAAVWGAFQNAGQACTGIERAIVVDAVYDRFVEKVVARAERVRASGLGAKIGPITMPRQVDVIRSHVEDAIRGGARALVGGAGAASGAHVEPVVLVDVAPDAPALTEETFGPVLPIVRVRDADEAVEVANRLRYGLGSAVFAGRRAMELAGRLRTGMTSVNSALSFAAVATLPFGGVGESGFGRIHGPEGLREFTVAHAVTRQRFPLAIDFLSFDHPHVATRLLVRAMRLRLGRHRRRG